MMVQAMRTRSNRFRPSVMDEQKILSVLCTWKILDKTCKKKSPGREKGQTQQSVIWVADYCVFHQGGHAAPFEVA